MCVPRGLRYELRRDRLRGGSEKKKAQYEAPRAPERALFKVGVEGSSPHPSLKGESEGRGAYSVLLFDVRNGTFSPGTLLNNYCICVVKTA